MRTRTLTAVTALVAAGLMIGGCQDGEPVFQPCFSCESISVTPQSVSIAVGDSAQLAAQVQTTGDADPPVIWESADTTVATVDSTGLVFGKGPGSTTVTATVHESDGSKSAAAEVNVHADTTSSG